jgi:hypothetical protein
MDLKRCVRVWDSIYLAQDKDQWRKIVNAAKNIQAPYKKKNFTTQATISFSKNTLLHGVNYVYHFRK